MKTFLVTHMPCGTKIRLSEEQLDLPAVCPKCQPEQWAKANPPELVTPLHPILVNGEWVRAKTLFGPAAARHYKGKVYNLEIDTDEPIELSHTSCSERSYTLSNGLVVHNAAGIQK